jgi:hypothetical protein
LLLATLYGLNAAKTVSNNVFGKSGDSPPKS